MTSNRPESRAPWIWAAAGAIAVAALILGLFRGPVPKASPPPPAGPKPTLELPAPEAQLVNDQAAFKDPTPLFLPTAWNSAPPDRGRRAPGSAFAGYDPYYVFNSNDLHLNLPPAVAVPIRPVNALVDEAPGNPVLGVGRVDSPVAAVPSRWAFVEIVTEGGGSPVFSQSLTGPAFIEGAATAFRDGDWRPVEFTAAVNAAGLVGRLEPVVRPERTVSNDDFLQLSGNAVAMLEDYLARNLRVGARLPPGFYRVMVGP